MLIGTQQSLYIALSVIVVGIAVFVGVNLLDTYYEENNRDQVIIQMHRLADMAQEYRKKPKAIGGGGGNTYRGWTMPKDFRRTELGRFRARVRWNRVNFTGIGIETGKNGRTKVRVVLILRPDDRRLRIRN
jgi:hypothetical protein